MKKLALIFLLMCFVLSGCGKYFIPLEGILEDSTKKRLQYGSSDPPNIAVYLEKEFTKKVFEQKSDGATCGHSYSQIPIGAAFSNVLIEGLRIAFPKMKLVESPERPSDLVLVKIQVEKLEIGFEYSAMGRCDTPKMDKGSIKGTFLTQIINVDNKLISEVDFDFEEKEIDKGMPPPTQAGVLEKCMNKIVTKYIRQIREHLKK